MRLAIAACPVCGSSHDADPALPGTSLVRCSSCGAVRSTEVAHPDELYSSGYHEGMDGRFVAPHPLFTAYVERVHRDRVALLDLLVERPGHLVDVGCGDGGLLAAARAAGWSVAGVEPVAATAHRGAAERGLDIRAGTLPMPGLEGADVVTALHVLEHVANPGHLLGLLRDVARPGGAVVVEVPNFGSAARERLGDGWPLLQPDEHITHFTADSLRRTFAAAGLPEVRISSPSWTGPPQPHRAAARDLGLDRAYPWPVLRVVEAARQRALRGQTLWAVATTATS